MLPLLRGHLAAVPHEWRNVCIRAWQNSFSQKIRTRKLTVTLSGRRVFISFIANTEEKSTCLSRLQSNKCRRQYGKRILIQLWVHIVGVSCVITCQNESGIPVFYVSPIWLPFKQLASLSNLVPFTSEKMNLMLRIKQLLLLLTDNCWLFVAQYPTISFKTTMSSPLSVVGVLKFGPEISQLLFKVMQKCLRFVFVSVVQFPALQSSLVAHYTYPYSEPSVRPQ